MLTLESPELRVILNPDYGAEIVHLGSPHGENVLAAGAWESPLRASRSVSYGDSRSDWLSEYRGGWQELFPNAGAACEVDGVPLPFHGEVSSARWEIVEQSESAATLRVPARLPLVLERRMHVSGPTLRLEETVTNEGRSRVQFLWGHHPAFDARPGMVIDLPGAGVEVEATLEGELVDLEPGSSGRWPYATGPDGGTVDLRVVPDRPVERLCYLTDLDSGWAALRVPEHGEGVALSWDVAAFPHAWLWHQHGGQGAPWWGRARSVAIEPMSAWPFDGLAAAIARGTAHRVEPGERLETWLTIGLFDATEVAVAHVDRAGLVYGTDIAISSEVYGR